MTQTVKNLPAMQETCVRSLGWEDPLEKGVYPLQYAGLENSTNCIVHGVKESDMTERPSTVGVKEVETEKPHLRH